MNTLSYTESVQFCGSFKHSLEIIKWIKGGDLPRERNHTKGKHAFIMFDDALGRPVTVGAGKYVLKLRDGRFTAGRDFKKSDYDNLSNGYKG